MKVGPLKKWIEEQKDTFAWTRTTISLLPEFNKEKIFLHTITDDTILSDEIYGKIKELIKKRYDLEVPNFIEN